MTSLYQMLSRHRDLDKTAFEDQSGARISYKSLFDRADSLGDYLNTLMGSGNHTVGVYQEKSITAAVSIFGVLAAEKAFVPIDPNFPRERISYIIDNASIRLLIVDTNISQDMLKQLEGKEIAVLQYDSITESVKMLPGSQESCLNQIPLVSEDPISYILFTSGTTGQPKGVMIKDLSQRVFVKTMAEAFGHDCDTRWLSVSPLYFDVCTLDLFVEAYCGSTVVLVAPNIMAHELTAALEKHKITHVLLISSLIKMLASRYSNIENHDLSNLKELWYGGEACPVESLRRVQTVLPQLRFAQCYGPSEVCNNATLYKFDSVPDNASGYMPLGKTIDSVEGYVVDDKGELLTAPGIGELLLGGVQVMSGYVNDKALTDKVLIDDRFNPDSPYKLYRTGDYVRLDENGLLHFHGRKDDLVKMRGNRISLYEVQKAIVSDPEVMDAVVFVKRDGISGLLDSLNAIVVSDAAIKVNELKIKLKERLAKYMIPDYIYIANKSTVPIKENGKINRAELLSQYGGE